MVHTSAGGRAEFVCDTAGTALIIHVRGEIDHHTAVAIRGGIDTILYEKRPERLILELSSVGFMDSSGLGLIMGRLAVMRELGGALMVSNPSREVMAIMALAGMERIVQVVYTEGHEPPTPPTDRSRAAARRTSTARHRRTPRGTTEAVSSIEVVGQAATTAKSPKTKER